MSSSEQNRDIVWPWTEKIVNERPTSFADSHQPKTESVDRSADGESKSKQQVGSSDNTIQKDDSRPGEGGNSGGRIGEADAVQIKESAVQSAKKAQMEEKQYTPVENKAQSAAVEQAKVAAQQPARQPAPKPTK